MGHVVLEQVDTEWEGERASKQQKIFQKSMPWTLPTFLVLEEPTHFSAAHKQHPAMRSSPGGMAEPAAALPEGVDFTPEVIPQKVQDGVKAPRYFPAEPSQATLIYCPFACSLLG